MKKKIRSIFEYLIILIIIFSITLLQTGCRNKFSKILSYSVQSIPKNLDPQTASENDEITIINNVFEGLFKRNFDNTFSLAAASDLTYDETETTATFTIKPNLKWTYNSNNSNKIFNQVTAADFEFALKRLLNPQTNSPFAQNYYFIKNAKLVHEGKLSLDNLGIYSNQNKLVLKLNHPTPNLDELLSLSPAMPCNEQFFNSTNGRYGLSPEFLINNGPFMLNSWLQGPKNQRIRLRPNMNYINFKNIKIDGINISQRPQNEALKLIQKKELDSTFLNLSDSIELDLDKNIINKIQFFQNSTSGIIFNYESSLFKNEKIRKAFALTINRELLKSLVDKNKATIAFNLIPDSLTINSKPFNSLKNGQNSCLPYDPNLAKQLFTEGIKELQSKNKDVINLNEFSILVNENYHNILNEILQNWQKELNIYLKIEICDEKTYSKNLKNGNFDCAFINIKNDYNSLECMLNKFLPDSPFNVANIYIPNLKQCLDNAISAPTSKEMIDNFIQAETAIIDSGSFIPVFHPTNIFIFNDKFKNILLIPSCQQLYFEFAEPEK